MKTRNKALLASLLVVGTIGFSASRANAFLKLPGPLQGLWDRSFGVVEQYAGFALERLVGDGLSDLAGALNLPDPTELFDWIDGVADGEVDSEGNELAAGLNSGSVQGSQAASLKKAQGAASIGGALSESVLSIEGQDATVATSDHVKAAADQASDCAKAGSDLFVTQDIEKQQLCIDAARAQVDAVQAAELAKSNRLEAASLLTQSEQLKAANKEITKATEEANAQATGTLGQATFLNEVLKGQ